jgi:hypothetical protein
MHLGKNPCVGHREDDLYWTEAYTQGKMACFEIMLPQAKGLLETSLKQVLPELVATLTLDL